jgi:hypothetical protein
MIGPTLRIELQNDKKVICDNNLKDKISNNKFYHACFTYDLNKIRCYINGKKLANKSDMTGDIIPEQSLNIGKNEKRDCYLNGSILEVKIFNEMLSGEDVKKHIKINEDEAKKDERLIGYWPLNDSLKNVITDKKAKSSGNFEKI